ncbi:hypothetical protein KCP70_24850 [Salmonella enterica subsp. enterica]|nr:hypothetical protein KCP70_24850 [Salmonella enterica subsp. enterica]
MPVKQLYDYRPGKLSMDSSGMPLQLTGEAKRRIYYLLCRIAICFAAVWLITGSPLRTARADG